MGSPCLGISTTMQGLNIDIQDQLVLGLKITNLVLNPDMSLPGHFGCCQWWLDICPGTLTAMVKREEEEVIC